MEHYQKRYTCTHAMRDRERMKAFLYNKGNKKKERKIPTNEIVKSARMYKLKRWEWKKGMNKKKHMIVPAIYRFVLIAHGCE